MRRSLLALAAVIPLFAVEVVNHHPFPIRQPMTLATEAVMIDIGASETKTMSAAPPPPVLAATADRDGLRLTYRGQDAGRLSWSLAMQQAAPFAPLPLTFKSAQPAPLYTDWEAKAARDG